MNSRSGHGFTIVELLIVIVVIGILAAITIVSFNGIQSRAHAAQAQSGAEAVAKLLAIANINTGAYPADLSTINNGQAMSVSDGTSYTYHPSGGNTSYCVTVTNATTSYKVTNAATAPVIGGCPGDGVGGVAAITNLVRNPKGTGSASSYYNSGWFYPLGTTIDTQNVTYASRSDWHNFTAATTGNAIMRERINLSDLVGGQTYTASVLVANPGTSSFIVEFDFCDQGSLNFTILPGETRRISVSGSRATYDDVYSFVDLQPSTISGSGLLVSDLMVMQGLTTFSYADGSSPNWIWNGTVSNSTSTGPVQ